MKYFKVMSLVLAISLLLQCCGLASLAEAVNTTVLPKATGYQSVLKGKFNGRSYEVFSGSGTWEEARVFAESMKGYLTCITSEEEQEYVSSLVSQFGHACWLGGYLDGEWKWVSDEPFKYTNWDEGEPSGYIDGRKESYLGIYGNSTQTEWATDKMWNDFTTTTGTVKGIIVEYSLVGWWESITDGQYLISVVDENGNPLEGASVTFDGETIITGEEGTALFSAFTYDSTVIEVEKDGYIKWSNQDSNWTKSSTRYETVILYPEAVGSLKLKSALYSNSKSMSSSTNLLTTTKKLSLGNEASLIGDLDFGNFYISCKAYDAANAASYQLWQGTKKIAESTDGSFALNTDSFAKGNNCFIRTVAADKSFADTRINLTFVKAEINEEHMISLSSKGFAFNVADNVPFLGGSKLNVNVPIKIPVNVNVSESKVVITFNAKLPDPKEDKAAWKKQVKEFKELCSDIKRLVGGNGKNGLNVGKLNGGQTRKYNSFIKNTNQWNFFKGGEIKVLGYAEADWGSSTATGCIILQGKIDPLSYDFNTWCVVVPVTVQVDMSLEGSLIGEIKYNLTSSSLDGNLSFVPAATLNAFGGVGVSKLVGVGAYGSAKLEGEFEILPDPSVDRVDLTGELGLKAYLGMLTYERPFAYNTWHLYTGNTVNASSLSDPSAEDELTIQQQVKGMFDASQYKKADLSYLSEEKDMMGTAKDTISSASLQSEFTTLIQNTYRNAQPVMAATEDAVYAAFLRADSSGGRVYTVVSKYDGTDWSTAVAATSAGKLDNLPELLADGNGNIWLAYAETNADYDESSLLSYARNQNIVVGSIDPETLAFTKARSYAGEGYAHMHQLSLVNGKPTLVWVDSVVTDDNSVLWPESNAFYSAECNGGTWAEARLVHAIDKPVFEMAVGEENGELSLSYIEDNDSSYETTGDQNLYMVSGDTVKLLANECAGKVTFGCLPGTETPVFIWNSGDELHTSDENTVTVSGINAEYIINGNNVYFSTATEAGAELYFVRYEDGNWSNPIKITEGSGYFEDLCVVTLNGTDYAMGMYANVTISDSEVIDSKDLVWTKVTGTSNLSIQDVSYDPDGIAAGETVPVTLSIANNGDHVVTNADVYVNGEKVISELLNLHLGKTTEIVVDVTCPDMLSEFTFGIYEAGMTDSQSEDNEAKLQIGYPDINVLLQSQQIGTRCSVYACVTNEGIGSASGKLYFINGENEIIGEQYIKNLASGGMTVASCDLDWNEIETDRIDITAIFECTSEDLYDYNNTDTLHVLYAGHRKDETPDMTLPAILQFIEDEAFLRGNFISVRIPEGVMSIGSRAFANCNRLEQIEIPASVTSIAADAFEGTDGFVIYCPEGSYAEIFAEYNGITCIVN